MDLQKANISFVSPKEVLKETKSDSVLLAFSGGADSSLLLRLTVQDSKINGYKVYIAHFNHKIRGEEANRDEEFSKATAKEYGIEYFVGSADIPSLSKNSGLGIECVAREYRYKFLSEIMDKIGCKVLLTAHNSDDRAETFLINLLRGSGLNGLSGLKEKRNLDGEKIVFRPILDTKKADVYKYCKENGIKYVEDSTNADVKYKRNRIRHKIIPEILKLQPEFLDVIKRTAENLDSDNAYLNQVAVDFVNNNRIEDGIEIDKLPKEQAIFNRVFSIYFAKYSSISLENIHLKNAYNLVFEGKNNTKISLKDNFWAKINGNKLKIEKSNEKEIKEFSLKLNFGKSQTDYYEIIAEKTLSAQKIQKNQLYVESLNGLFFTNRRESDEIFVSSMHKKVRKLQNEAKIDAELRDFLPILRNGDGEVLFVPYVAVSDKMKNEKKNILITVSRKDTI